MKEQIKILKKHILTGTSHMIPFIVAGGILFSISVMLNPAGAATPTEGWLAGLAQIGLGGLTLFVPVLGGYIAYSIADKPGLAPGMIGAYLANSMGAGFLGGMAAGLIAGVVVKQLKKIKLPISLKTLGSIFIYPLLGTFITGGIIVWGIGTPIAFIMQSLTSWLSGLGDVGRVPLATILGAMTAFDMGGPINKVATLFDGRCRCGYLYASDRHGYRNPAGSEEVQCRRKRSRQGGYPDGMRGNHRRCDSICSQ